VCRISLGENELALQSFITNTATGKSGIVEFRNFEMQFAKAIITSPGRLLIALESLFSSICLKEGIYISQE